VNNIGATRGGLLKKGVRHWADSAGEGGKFPCCLLRRALSVQDVEIPKAESIGGNNMSAPM
jgi:hypothetical protein